MSTASSYSVLGAESRGVAGLSCLLRMTTPLGVDTDMIMVGTIRLVRDVEPSAAGLERVGWTNERLTTVPIFEPTKTIPQVPDHMEWKERFHRLHSDSQYAHPLDVSRSRFHTVASTCTVTQRVHASRTRASSESSGYIPVLTSLLGSLPHAYAREGSLGENTRQPGSA